MAAIVHFDVPVDDVDRAKAFYEKLFDWKIEKAPGETPYYFIESRNLNGEPGVAGGMGQRGKPGQQITNFIGVPSVDEYLKRVEQLGGRIVEPRMPVPGFGYLAVCQDTENNAFGLWQDDENATNE